MSSSFRSVWTIIIVTLVMGGGVLVGSMNRPQSDDIQQESLWQAYGEGTKTVKIGVMSTTDNSFPQDRFLADIARAEINAYCDEADLEYRFDFIYTNANGQAGNVKNITIRYHDQGVRIIIGFGWSSFFCSSAYTFGMENNMTLISPSSTSPIYNIEDHVFRLCTNDLNQILPIAAMIKSLHVSGIVILQRDDAWGDGIVWALKELIEDEGSPIIETIKYACEDTTFHKYLDEAEEALQRLTVEKGISKPGVFAVSFNEVETLLQEATTHPELLSVPWFGSEEIASSARILDEAGDEAVKVMLTSPQVDHVPEGDESRVYKRLNASYFDETGYHLGFYTANVYDACWIAALSVIEAGTDNGADVQRVLPYVAAGYTGATGRCLLDENGDRDRMDYSLSGYFEVDGEYRYLRCGKYHHGGSVEWNWELLGPG
ncbi:MAG: ABC transporter substrate-binding protein [Candidatus Bathyarchaeota archaeon]|nr:MAG: ABC transporter substrate-binding protein [Candidatus Bathyarchaeota archaeon]